MKTERKQRRKKKELDETIWNTFEKMVIEHGFNAITIAGLAKEAGVELPVLYNRFENLEDLFGQYARRNDFWLNSSTKIDPKLSFKENCFNVYSTLIDNLYENEIMQRILLWELNDTHKITHRIAMSREFENNSMLAYLNNGLKNNGVKNTGVNLNFLNSMIISGIYFLILHKKISTFSSIDFNLEESKEQLKETIKYMVDKMFE
jgi:AcrR family transcriptional regulator